MSSSSEAKDLAAELIFLLRNLLDFGIFFDKRFAIALHKANGFGIGLEIFHFVADHGFEEVFEFVAEFFDFGCDFGDFLFRC